MAENTNQSLKDKFSQKWKFSFNYLLTSIIYSPRADGKSGEVFVSHETFLELHGILLSSWMGTKYKKTT